MNGAQPNQPESQVEQVKQLSNSSDEPMDTSDEMHDVVMEDFFAGADPGAVPEMQDPQLSTSG